jgi:hypothetical protein
VTNHVRVVVLVVLVRLNVAIGNFGAGEQCVLPRLLRRGKRSVLLAEVLLLSTNYGHTTPVREVAPLPSVLRDQVLRARSRKHLLPNRRAPTKQTEAPQSILHSRLRRVPTGRLEPAERGRPDNCRRHSKIATRVAAGMSRNS